MRQGGNLGIGGAVDASSVTLPEGVTNETYDKLAGTEYIYTSSIANRIIGVQSGTIDTNDDAEIAKKAYTVCVQVNDGVVTVWEKQTPDKAVSVKLTSAYQGGLVSLFSNNANSGAFRSFGIEELNSNFEYEMAQSLNVKALSTLKDYFVAYQFNTQDSTVTKSEDPDEYWNVNGESQNGGFERKGWLIPEHRGSAGKISTLTLKNKMVRNFEASYTYSINWTEYGIMVAPEGQQVNKNYGLGLSVYVNSEGKIILNGAYDKNSVKNVGFEDKLPNFVEVSSGTKNKTYTVHVSVADKVVKVWLDEYPDCYVTANLTAGYQGGALSLYATGCDQGSFTQFAIKKYMEDPAVENANLTYRKEIIGNYTVVTLYTDGVTDVMYRNALKYDTEKYTYIDTRLIDSVSAYNDPVGADKDGQVELSMISRTDKKQAVVIFKNNTDTAEKVPFTMTGDMYGIGGIAMNVTLKSAFYGDVTNDDKVDVLDLIRLRKYAANESVEINQANSDLDDTGVYGSDTNLALMRKSLVGIGSIQID